jgi:hypothetical protein
MTKLLREIRLTLFVWLLLLLTNLIPKEAQDTWRWLAKMPREDVS